VPLQRVAHVQDVAPTRPHGGHNDEYSVSTQYIKVLSVTDERAGALQSDMHRPSRQQVCYDAQVCIFVTPTPGRGPPRGGARVVGARNRALASGPL
jgi:hypothetical protein